MTWTHWETGDVWNSEGDYIYYLVIQMNNRAGTIRGLKHYLRKYNGK